MPQPLDRELKIVLALLQADSYRVELIFDDPNDDAAGRAISGKAAFGLPALERAKNDDSGYGLLLSGMLFRDPVIRDFFLEVKAKASDGALRLRLYIDADAADLNNIRWELLCDPKDHRILTASERILFSRFVVSGKWTSVKLRARSELRALIAVSDPTDLEANNMAKVRKEIEIPAARKALAGIRNITVLGENEPVTLEALIKEIRSGVDIVYLVCHGSYEREPVLFLQDEKGELKFANGAALSEAIRNLAEPPRLMVLASCESAGRNGRFAESALAPLLADAGVPAIVAMQAKVSMDTVGTMMPEFFSEIARDGQIDRAMAVARGVALRAEASDAWMPALFLRLKSGSLWYQPGFGGDADKESVSWASVCRAVVNKELVPVLGPDVAEHILGTSDEFAAALARTKSISLPPDERPDRPKIAQTIQTNAGRAELESVCKDLVKDKLKKSAQALPANGNAPSASALDRIVEALSRDPDDPFRILSSLDIKVFITGAMDSLMQKFLKKAGKYPLEIFSDWRNEASAGQTRVAIAAEELCRIIEQNPVVPPLTLVEDWLDKLGVATDRGGLLPDSLRAAADSVIERLKDHPGAPPLDVVREWRDLTCNSPGETLSKPWPVKTPIIYYVYGKYQYPGTWVLTQDDYFDYLIRHASYKLMPPMVADKLVSGSLLFLGFSLDDWTFRILFRMILSKDGSELLRRDKYKHIGVQIDPENHTAAELARIKPLLVKYFGAAANINIYWGSSADFLKELRDRMRDFKPAAEEPDAM